MITGEVMIVPKGVYTRDGIGPQTAKKKNCICKYCGEEFLSRNSRSAVCTSEACQKEKDFDRSQKLKGRYLSER